MQAPAPDTIQSYCENPGGSFNEHHSVYRMDTCLRFDPDGWNNQFQPDRVMGTGTSGAPDVAVTLGRPNPGQCTLGGPPSVTLRISRCPVVIGVDGVTMGSPIYLFASDVFGPTQASGNVLGLHMSPLLFGILAGPIAGVANLPGTCTSGAYEVPIGNLPPLCLEFSAIGLADTASGASAVVSNVVRFH